MDSRWIMAAFLTVPKRLQLLIFCIQITIIPLTYNLLLLNHSPLSLGAIKTSSWSPSPTGSISKRMTSKARLKYTTVSVVCMCVSQLWLLHKRRTSFFSFLHNTWWWFFCLLIGFFNSKKTTKSWAHWIVSSLISMLFAQWTPASTCEFYVMWLCGSGLEPSKSWIVNFYKLHFFIPKTSIYFPCT